jgi:selenide, water dikinase
MNIMQPIRLSQLSHGGGCGCKLAPSVLQQLLSSHPAATRYTQLLVGVETGDDAGSATRWKWRAAPARR